MLFYLTFIFIQLKAKAVSELLYAFLYGTPICTFYKLSVHAGLLIVFSDRNVIQHYL